MCTKCRSKFWTTVFLPREVNNRNGPSMSFAVKTTLHGTLLLYNRFKYFNSSIRKGLLKMIALNARIKSFDD